MKKAVPVILLCIFLSTTVHVLGQEKGKSESESADKTAETKKEFTPLRVQVVFSEYEGEKKVSSFLYMLPVNAETPLRGQKAAIRMGLKVPIMAGTSTTGSQGQIQYLDVGAYLDVWAGKLEDGRFNLHLSLERSSPYSSGKGQKTPSVGSYDVPSMQPVIQTFRSEMDLLIRDGQTMQSAVATDPVSGRVTKVDVTVTLIK